MQTIEDSLLRVSVDEDGASLTQLLSQVAQVDFMKALSKSVINFPEKDPQKNWAMQENWTVVDKGDSRVSLTLIDSEKSYRAFPYHFELMATYAIEGNGLVVTFLLRNNSNKKMPYVLTYRLPKMLDIFEQKLGEITLSDEKNSISISSDDLTLTNNDDEIIADSDQLELEGEETRTFKLKIIVK